MVGISLKTLLRQNFDSFNSTYIEAFVVFQI